MMLINNLLLCVIIQLKKSQNRTMGLSEPVNMIKTGSPKQQFDCNYIQFILFKNSGI